MRLNHAAGCISVARAAILLDTSLMHSTAWETPLAISHVAVPFSSTTEAIALESHSSC